VHLHLQNAFCFIPLLLPQNEKITERGAKFIKFTADYCKNGKNII